MRMHDVIIVRYAEIALKGKNRIQFEKRLVHNISFTLRNRKIAFRKIHFRRGRIFIQTENDAQELSEVFGIASYSYAQSCSPEIDEIKKFSDSVIDGYIRSGSSFETFRVSANRMDDSIKQTSLELNIAIGDYINTKYDKKVKLKGADLELCVEIFEGKAYVFTQKQPGPGGLPVGSTGKVMVLADRETSFVAAKLMMKRGCRVSFAVEQGEAGKSYLAKIGRMEKYNCFEEFRIVEYKTYDDLPCLLRKKRARALVLGIGLDDMPHYEKIRSVCGDCLTLLPLVGFDDKEITNEISEIQVFQGSDSFIASDG
jgi:tRNA uracil 4-sulfurtransferase